MEEGFRVDISYAAIWIYTVKIAVPSCQEIPEVGRQDKEILLGTLR